MARYKLSYELSKGKQRGNETLNQFYDRPVETLRELGITIAEEHEATLRALVEESQRPPEAVDGSTSKRTKAKQNSISIGISKDNFS